MSYSSDLVRLAKGLSDPAFLGIRFSLCKGEGGRAGISPFYSNLLGF